MLYILRGILFALVSLGLYADELKTPGALPNGPTRIFGLELGAPFTLPECPFYSGQNEHNNHAPDHNIKSAPCFQHSSPSADLGAPVKGVKKVRIITNNPLSGEFTGEAYGVVINGYLDGVQLLIDGFNAQESIALALERKYGKPTEHRLIELHRSMGVKLEVISQFWAFANINVQFEGMLSPFDRGLILVRTTKWQEHEKKELEAMKAADLKL